LKVGTDEIDALWATELMVSPPFRLRGIGAVLSALVCDEARVTLGWNISVEAKRAYLRAGWVDLGTVPLYLRPIDVAAVFRARSRAEWMPIAHGATLGLRAVELAGRSTAAMFGLRMQRVTAFDERA